MTKAGLLARRNLLLGEGVPLFYDEPVHIVRGEGVMLYDADGRQYLDMYNNVPCVGHAHPRVVQAMTEQARTLNVHSRYLPAGILHSADTVLAPRTPTPPAMTATTVYPCIATESFAILHKRFNFTIDAAAQQWNARLPRYWTPEDDALQQDWAGERIWCHPPFTDGTLPRWIAKATASTEADLIEMLLPDRPPWAGPRRRQARTSGSPTRVRKPPPDPYLLDPGTPVSPLQPVSTQNPAKYTTSKQANERTTSQTLQTRLTPQAPRSRCRAG